MAIKRILVPVDFSKDSLSALNYASEFAAAFKSELVLVYVVEPIYFATPSDMYAASAESTMFVEEQRITGTQQLARLSEQLKKKGHAVRTMVKGGAPSQTIVDTARSTGTDLIVMATHGRTGLYHMLMGSVAERVVRTAHCPVLTVRPAAKHPKPSMSPKRSPKATKAKA